MRNWLRTHIDISVVWPHTQSNIYENKGSIFKSIYSDKPAYLQFIEERCQSVVHRIAIAKVIKIVRDLIHLPGRDPFTPGPASSSWPSWAHKHASTGAAGLV